jgi:DNA-binding NtrC family response regulator
VAKTDANVLILGENGTGKELVARAIHQKSLRKDNSFVAVDMGAITETLFESELFGHKKGSFTDAREDRPGRFELANGGTLFLDEIGNLSMALQSKLLTALQSRKVTRVGSNQSIDVDIRLVCATNMPLHQMVAEGKFRQDLLYRINTVEINIPPLSERIDDIPMLANHFLHYYSKKYRKEVLNMSAEAMNKLKKYPWPGNVRELQHALERAVIMADSATLQESDFLFSRKGYESTSSDTLNLDEVEKAAVVKAIQLHNGNISKAADELGLTRASLYRRMEKYGL